MKRGREIKKNGGGGRNWGNDSTAEEDNEAANAEVDREENSAEGSGWGATNGATETEVRSGFLVEG